MPSDPFDHRSMFDVSAAIASADRRRLRERYIAQRFPQLKDPLNDLRRTRDVLNLAQQCIEDDRRALALELMTLALQEDPSQRPLWLFMIEDAFLRADSARFNALADEFRGRFEADEALVFIDAMAHDLAPKASVKPEISEPLPLPEWSDIGQADRDLVLQQKLHAALVHVASIYRGR
jgi:hypothetical protein